jgi:acetolactate synthase-1/3 small subunit
MQRHILNVLVENSPGVLARIVGHISGRGYNIETLNVGPTTDPSISKMTIGMPGEPEVITQVVAQLAKQISVFSVVDVTAKPHIDREAILVKVSTRATGRAPVIEVAMLFGAKVLGVHPDSLTIQMVGSQMQVEQFLTLLQPFDVVDISRSGSIAMAQD